jgi:hypothetical protein
MGTTSPNVMLYTFPVDIAAGKKDTTRAKNWNFNNLIYTIGFNVSIINCECSNQNYSLKEQAD